VKKLSKLILTEMNYRNTPILVAALEKEGRICQLNPMSLNSDSILGNIYIGKVKNIQKNIQAAFIEIENGIMCYYSMAEKASPCFVNVKKNNVLKIGDEMIVQVSKEGIKSKLPYVSSNLNFTGRYLVLTSERKELGFSGKLKKEEKKQIREILKDKIPENVGIIVRTNCRDAQEEEILHELEELMKRYEAVLQKGKSRVCFSVLEKSMPEYVQILQNLYSQDLEEIVTDKQELYECAVQYLKGYKQQEKIVRYYEDKLLPLYKLYNLQKAFEQAQNERVWLKSGGFLVIQQTEAFVCIDVNTGKCTSKKDMQETFRKINLEAAKEIAWQLRLRNLSGIILIDFINLERAEDKEELMQTLQKYLWQDSIKGTVVDMTELNIVEVTRKKVRKSLAEELKELL
jgi:ribonuclease G